MTFRKLSLVIFLGLFYVASSSAQSALKRANKQYELSEFGTAINSYKEVLKRDPDHLEANMRIGDCYRMMNEFEKALPHYQSAVAQGNLPDLYVFQYGLTLQGLARYDIAEKVFEQLAISSSPFRTRALQFAEACKFANSQTEPARFTIKAEYLNTSGSDFAPTFFQDGQVVYASSRSDIKARNSRNAPGGNDIGSNRLFITQRDRNGYLESPKTLHSGFGAGHNDAPVAYSQDGRWVAITKNNFSAGVRQIPSSGVSLNLYLANPDTEGNWVEAKPFQYNGAGYSNGYPTFSPDGRALYFASDRPGGYGGFDIYMCVRVGDSWSAPENLGQPINSAGNEISPFFDGLSLYFSSDFHQGFGGMDIFRAEESGERWATIFHGGPGLNSSSDDYGFVFDPLRNIGYFTSNRPGGKGMEDIYKVEKETDNVVMKVTDAASGAPLAEAEIDFTECGDQSYLTNENGVFNFQLLEDLNCTATIRKDGYISAPVKITSMGLRQNRNLAIALTSMKDAYQGKAVNASTGYYLEEVKIIATEKGNSDNPIITYTNAQGDYSVALLPNKNYLVRYSKAGFQDVTLNFRTAKDDSKLVRNIELLPVGVTGSGSSGVPIVEVETAKPVDNFSGPSGTGKTAKSLPSGFAIQLASIAGNKDVDLEKYSSKLKGMGDIYAVNEGGRTKVRLGVFANKTEASAAQQKARDRGFDGAFLVSEKEREVSVGASSSSSTSTPSPAKPESTNNADALNGYMVRLAAYSNLDYFNSGTVDDLGYINYMPKGEVTLVLLGGYDSVDSARIGLRKAKVRGFPDAYLVHAKNGVIEKVN